MVLNNLVFLPCLLCIYHNDLKWWMCAVCQDDVQFGVNLDVTSYINGKRDTHNPPGRALPYTVWDFYEVNKIFIFSLSINPPVALST